MTVLQKLLGVTATGFYGTVTQAAVEKFQLEQGIAKKGEPGFGQFGPRTIAKVQEVFSSDMAALSSVESSLVASQQTTAPGGAPSARPSTGMIPVLSVGSRASEVQAFQRVLGVSPTGFFGPVTKKAVENFQIKYGIAKVGEPGFGQVGPRTRAKIQEVFPGAGISSIPVSTPVSPTSQGSPPTINNGNSISLGQRNSTVQELQRDLITLGFLAQRNDTGFYGSLTEAAVKQFQCKNNIVCSGTPRSTGWGLAGPKTRGVLNGLR